MKNGDILFGTIGATTTYVLSHFDKALAILAGILTVSILALRLRREWKHRNDPPAE